MDLKSGYPYPLIKNGLPFDYPKLRHDAETQVAILGGGISGALAAYFLTEAGIPCMVLDARSIGLGSTCASTSLLQYEIDVPLHRLIRQIGYEKAVQAYRLCAESINTLGKISETIGLQRFGFRHSVYFAASENDVAYLEEEYRARQQAGFTVRLLRAPEVHEAYGFHAPAAIVSEPAAVTDAYLMTHLLHQHNLRHGAQVFDRTEATQVDSDSRGVHILTADGHRIRARKLVFAMGYGVNELPEKDLVSLHSTYVCISESFPPEQVFWKGEAVLWSTARPYLYLRTTDDRRIIIGGHDDAFHQAGWRDRRLASKTRKLVRDFRTLFPHLDFVPEFSWAGVFGSTPDGLPYIGPHPDFPDRYFSLGFGGNGITFGAVGAEIIRDLCLGKPNPHTELFSFHRNTTSHEYETKQQEPRP